MSSQVSQGYAVPGPSLTLPQVILLITATGMPLWGKNAGSLNCIYTHKLFPMRSDS